MAAKNSDYSVESCECNSKRRNSYDCHYSQSSQTNQDNYPYLDAYWYQQFYSQYWRWRSQHNVLNQRRHSFPAWCSTCVEEREERIKREKLTQKRTCCSRNCVEETFLADNFSQSNKRVQYSKEPNLEIDSEESSGDEFEMVLNSDFKKFLEQSAKHKEQRKKEAKLNQMETDDYVEAGEIPLAATSIAPTQQQGIVRTEEMKRLYGNSARHIESLETSLQLHFNMNVDMRHPVFWPSIPLNFRVFEK